MPDSSWLTTRPPLILAQLGEPPYRPPALPTPPLLERWFLETPWTPALALLAAGVIAFVILSRRAQGRQAGLIGGGLVLAAAAIVALATLVKTERERLADRVRELIAVTAAADTARLRPMLAEDVALTVLGAPYPQTKSGILDLVEKYPGRDYPVSEHSVHDISAHVDRLGTGKTLARVRVVVDMQGTAFPHGSWWRITWRRDAAGEWNVVNIEALFIAGQTSSRLP